MNSVPSEELKRSEAAANWVLRLRAPNLDQNTATQWLEWCEADPRNRAAFEAMAEFWEVSGDLDSRAFASDLATAANDDMPEKRYRVLTAVAALFLAMLVAVTVWRLALPSDSNQQSQIATLETPLGQSQATTLEDGSRIEIGGRSILSVRFSRERRGVVAESGEAFFTVAHESDRPFVVEAGPVTVTAIGTAFSVQREGNWVTVGVTQGTVEIRVSSADQPGTVLRASAGHKIRYDGNTLTQISEPALVGDSAPWSEGRLEFRDEPLWLVVSRINRYSRVQIEISDTAIAELRITTTVYDDRVDAWLDSLSQALPIRVSRPREDRAVIAPAA